MNSYCGSSLSVNLICREVYKVAYMVVVRRVGGAGRVCKRKKMDLVQPWETGFLNSHSKSNRHVLWQKEHRFQSKRKKNQLLECLKCINICWSTVILNCLWFYDNLSRCWIFFCQLILDVYQNQINMCQLKFTGNMLHTLKCFWNLKAFYNSKLIAM